MVENQSLVLFNTEKTNKNDLLLSLLHDYSVVYNNIFQIKYCWHLLLRKIHLEFFVLNFFFALISSIYSCLPFSWMQFNQLGPTGKQTYRSTFKYIKSNVSSENMQPLQIQTPRENQNKVKIIVKTYSVSTIFRKTTLGWLSWLSR